MTNSNTILSGTIEQIKTDYKKLLKQKDAWLFIQINFNNNIFLLKQYNKWVQIAKNNQYRYLSYGGNYSTQKDMLIEFEKMLLANYED